MRFRMKLVVVVAVSLSCGVAMAQTPDGLSPAAETWCDGYDSDAHGACVVYCEAQDCNEGWTEATDPSCRNAYEAFLAATGTEPPCLFPGSPPPVTAPPAFIGAGRTNNHTDLCVALDGKAFGLCVSFCEAKDCASDAPHSEQACDRAYDLYVKATGEEPPCLETCDSSPESAIGGGDGSAEDPFLICAPHHLLFVNDNPAFFKLMAELDLTGYPHAPINVVGDFEGNGFSINHFTYVAVAPATVCVGLFAKVGPGAEVRNLNVGDVNVQGGTLISGGVVGLLYGTLNNVSVSGVVKGVPNGPVYLGQRLGGLVGEVTRGGVVTNCTADVAVFADSESGGAVGSSQGTVTDTTASGDVTGRRLIGGLVGANYTTISGSSATGNVIARAGRGGGLLGHNQGIVTHATASGNVSGAEDIGGAVGANYGTIQDSSASGDVAWTASPGYDVGGFAGRSWGTTALIERCSATGDATGTLIVGGFVASSQNGVVRESFATGDVTGRNRVAGFIGDSSGLALAENCYAHGSVSATNLGGYSKFNTGGFLGGGWKLVPTAITSFAAPRAVLLAGKPFHAFSGGMYCTGSGGCPAKKDLTPVWVDNIYLGQNDGCFETPQTTLNVDLTWWGGDGVSVLPGMSPVSLCDTTNDVRDRASYPASWDFEQVWIFPSQNPRDPWAAAGGPAVLPVLRWQCGRDGVVCP